MGDSPREARAHERSDRDHDSQAAEPDPPSLFGGERLFELFGRRRNRRGCEIGLGSHRLHFLIVIDGRSVESVAP